MATLGATVLGRRFELTVKAAPPLQDVGGRSNGWWPIVVREPFTGAWQVNMEARRDVALTYFAVFACVTLIASDIGKLTLQLLKQTADGTWEETNNPAFSPVLRKPNRYQTTHKFVEHWITSKLTWGNTYVLKQRDQRGVVVALYVLDPARVRPLVAPDGGVYYECSRDNLGGDLAGLGVTSITVPAREIIHDTMICLFHPLVGISPIYACGLAAMQGLSIQNNSSQLFANGSNPGGVLTAPGAISDEAAARIKAYFEDNFTGANVGRTAVLGDGLKYEAMVMSAVDAQLIEQLKWTGENVCSCFHVPSFMIGLGTAPHFATGVEPLLQLYYSQCLQSLLTNFEQLYDEGVGLADPIHGTQYGVAFDIDDLVWMDTATKTKAAADAIGAGAMSPDEARWKYFGLGPVTGGDTPYMQQQMFSLKALAQRDAADPFAKPQPAPMAAPATPTPTPSGEQVKHIDVVIGALLERALQAAA